MGAALGGAGRPRRDTGGLTMEQTFWRRCSTCKREIPFATAYWACNVSTCNRGRTALSFCTVACWDSHVPILRHRDAWAEERTSPRREEWEREEREREEAERSAAPATPPASARGPAATSSSGAPVASAPAPSRPASVSHAPGSAGATGAPPGEIRLETEGIPRDVLVVASKLKAYVRARSGMNTSDAVLEVLSDRLRSLCDQAIRRAAEMGRKTVLDRDF